MRTHSTSDAARLAAAFTGLLLVASVPVALAADASGLRPQAASLRAEEASLESRANAATLELYALEAELVRARSAVESATERRAAVAGARAATRRHLAIAKSALHASEAQLAELVRALYEQSGAADPLAILLGAASLDEALTGLDSLSRAAGQNSRIIEQARSSRQRLAVLDARLAAQEHELGRLAAVAISRTQALERAVGTRSSFVARLRQEQGLNAARIASIEAHARRAEARTLEISTSSASASTAGTEEASPSAVPAFAATSGATITVSTTGYALRGRTATGMPTGAGVAAVDPAVIPLGTRMTIPGYGVAIAADTGGAVHGNVIDLWFPTNAEALQWGRRTVTITIR